MRNVQAMQASSITINPCSNVRSSKGNSTVAFGGRTISPKIHQSQQAVASRSSLHFRCAHVPASDCARVLDRLGRPPRAVLAAAAAGSRRQRTQVPLHPAEPKKAETTTDATTTAKPRRRRDLTATGFVFFNEKTQQPRAFINRFFEWTGPVRLALFERILMAL